MQILDNSFLNVSGSDSIFIKLRVRLLQSVLLIITLVSLAFTVLNFVDGAGFSTGTDIVAPLATLFAIGLLLITSHGQLIGLSGLIAIAYILGMSIFLYSISGDVSVLLLLLCLSSLTAALLLSRIMYWISALITLAIVVWVATTQGMSNTPIATNIVSTSALLIISFGLIPLVIGSISRYFVAQLENTAIDAQRSASLLTVSADIGRNVSEMLSLTALLNHAGETIRDRFAYSQVSIFLLDDEDNYARLAASTHTQHEALIERAYRLPIDAGSVVGRAAQTSEFIIARDTDGRSHVVDTTVLVGGGSELAVPIIDNRMTVGIVYLQSYRSNAFSSIEIEALRVIANQLATAIRNARLFEDKEQSIQENQRLFLETETNLREIQRLNRQLTKQAWTDYLKSERRVSGVTLRDNQFSNKATWSEEMLLASQRRRAITESQDGKQKIAVPIELRGEIVGAIELETHDEGKQADVVDMVRSLSERLAVSLDNARLFEESNEITAQEQRVGDIVSQYQAANSVDDLLHITLEGLTETLGAEQASIRLGIIPEIQANQSADVNGRESS